MILESRKSELTVSPSAWFWLGPRVRSQWVKKAGDKWEWAEETKHKDQLPW